MSTANAPRDSLAVYQPFTVASDTPSPQRVLSMFVRGAVLAKSVSAVTGAAGLAHVPSQVTEGARAFLFWSTHHEASRWADVLVEQPEIVAIDLPAFVMETLPAIVAVGGTIGFDWGVDAECERSPGSIVGDILAALVADFVAVANKSRSIFVLQDMTGIASLPAADGKGPLIPIWSDRGMAEAAIRHADGFVTTVRMSLAEFTGRFLLSPQGVRSRIAPGYVHVADAPRFAPWEFKALLNGNGAPGVVRVA